MVTSGAPASPFGRRLRYWRGARGMSQLDLAAAAGTTSRHVSFIETGRSRPGRDLVSRLADVLALQLRERNDLMAAAGLPPAHPTFDLSSEELLSVTTVVDQVLARHEPYPAWVIGRGLRFLAANRPAQMLFPGLTEMTPAQVVELWFGAGPFRERVANWQDVVRSALVSLRREALLSGDDQIGALLTRAQELLGDLPPPVLGTSDGARELPVACPVLLVGGQEVRTISAVMRFDSATEVTTSELRVELMFPADEASAAILRSLTGTPGQGLAEQSVPGV